MHWLAAALELNGEMIARFADDRAGGLFFTAAAAEPLIARQKESYDGAMPSGNSVACLNFLRLARMTGEAELEERALGILRAFAADVRRAPAAHAHLLSAADFALGPTAEVILVGDPETADMRALLAAARQAPGPSRVLLLVPAGVPDPPIVRLIPYLAQYVALDGRATAYVCRDRACQLPTHDPAVMRQQLAGLARDGG